MDKVIVRFQNIKKHQLVDLEVPLDITAEDLIFGLNRAYSLGIKDEAIATSYLACEQPMVLVRGKTTLRELGVRVGSLLRYTL